MSQEQIEAMVSHKQFHAKAEYLLGELHDLIITVPVKGMIEEDCQRCCLLNRLNDLHSAVNGATVKDFIPNQ